MTSSIPCIKFVNDGGLDAITLRQELNAQTVQLRTELLTVKEEVAFIKKEMATLNKNIEKLVEILNQTNPRAKNLMIRSYSTSGVVAPFLKEH